MHIVGKNFISFTARNNALHMLGKKGDFWHFGGRGHGSFAHPLVNPLMNSDTLPFLFFSSFFSSPSSYIFSFLFFSFPFSFLSFFFLYFLSLRLEVRPLESILGALAPSVESGAEPQSKSNLVYFNL